MNNDEESGFYAGILVSLAHIRVQDAFTLASELVGAIGGLDELKKVAKRTENDLDADVIEWLENDVL